MKPPVHGLSLLAVALVLAGPLQAQTFQLLHTFDKAGDGNTPQSGVVQGSDGALYGTTYSGGASNLGTVYRINSDGSGYTQLHQFTGLNGDGANPYTGLTVGPDGTLYGTTTSGRDLSTLGGTLYRLKPDGSGYGVLHEFGAAAGDGSDPYAPPLLGVDGRLYGTTSGGGTNLFAGTVYGVNLDGSGYVVLHNFSSSDTNGWSPESTLIQGSDGVLYGVCNSGGSGFGGTLFRVNPDGTGFGVVNGCTFTTGASPNDLAQGPAGSLFGTASSGGSGFDGTVFQAGTNGAGLQVLHNFAGGVADGSLPRSGLTLASDGALYGMTIGGGASNVGTIFKLNRDGSGYTIVHHFTGATNDGAVPLGELFQGSDGALYGTTKKFGTNNNTGTLFRLAIASLPVVTLTAPTTGSAYVSTTDSIPLSGTASSAVGLRQVIWANSLGVSGVAAGTTEWSVPSLPLQDGTNVITVTAIDSGGNQQVATLNVIFHYTPPPTWFSVLHSFGLAGGDGSTPVAGVIQGPDGALYGSTSSGGSGGAGTIYRLGLDGSGYAVIQNFAYSTNLLNDGRTPLGSLLPATDGELYGTASIGGQLNPQNPLFFGGGTIFRISPSGGLTVPYHFDRLGGGGLSPKSGLIQGADGLLYGVAYSGGLSNAGTVFKVSPDGGSYTVLHHFLSFPANDGNNVDFLALGQAPGAPLLQAKDGTLYGATGGGGSFGGGTVFRLNPDGTGYAILHEFDSGGRAGDSLWGPSGGLIEGADGALYGTAAMGSATLLDTLKGAEGGVFKINPDGTGYTVLRYFKGGTDDGATPLGGLVQTPDGTLYGTTSTGGGASDGGLGTIFRLDPNGAAYAVLHRFQSNEGGAPVDRMMLGSDGALYGVARASGGAIFRLIISPLPVIDVDSPTTAPLFSTTSNSLSLTGSAVSSTGLARISWSNDRGGSGVATGTTNWTAGSIVLQGGTNVITLTALDANGNSQATTVRAVYVPIDTTPPVVTITSPTTAPAFASSGTAVDLSGTASDDVGVTAVSWSNSLGGGGTATGLPVWTAPGIPLQVGTNVITVTAVDAAHNQSRVTLSVIYTPPSIRITSPAPAAPFPTGTSTVTVDGTASGGYGGITSVTWENTANGSTAFAAGTTGWSASNIPLIAGTNLIRVTAADAAGNHQSAAVVVVATFSTPTPMAALSVLHTFSGPDGVGPESVLAQGADGTLYGTAFYGGPAFDVAAASPGVGTVFKMQPDGSGFTVVHGFTTNSSSPADPLAILVGKDGALYGVTRKGSNDVSSAGSVGTGLIYKVTTQGDAFATLVDPIGGQGYLNGLIQGSDGALYGVSPDWGFLNNLAQGFANLTNVRCGAVFKLNVDGSGYTILHSFDPVNNPNDAYHPQNVIEGSDGVLYGVAACGGTNNSGAGGVVFRLNKDGSGYAVLHTFYNPALHGATVPDQLPDDGFSPIGPLVQGPDGTLYGTTEIGGQSGGGTVYRLRTDGSGYTVLYAFGSNPTDGVQLLGGVTVGADGGLYGVATIGSPGGGTVFRLNTDGTGYSLVYRFGATVGSGTVTNADGAFPMMSLLRGRDGDFYGVTLQGGNNGFGTVFKLAISAAPRINAIHLGTAGVLLDVTASAGLPCQVQSTTNLLNNSWQTIGTTNLGAQATFQVLDPAGTTPPARFYRAVR